MKKWIFCTLLASILIACDTDKNYTKIRGKVFGTFYTITYLDNNKENYQEEITTLFQEFDNSLSTFNKNSIISRINQNDTTVILDQHFIKMYHTAKTVWLQTYGAFDISVAPLVNAWGFGYTKQDTLIDIEPDTLLPYIGFDKIRLKNGKIIKSNHRIQLDASAIAKGQACDMIADFLDKKGCHHFMIEIGGEVACKGTNPLGESWHIGIDKPYLDPANENNELQGIVTISNVGMATSGNYRQYYYKNGKKYAHTIDPRTGYPTTHNLLSATVIAQDCVTADAYATAFMVLGIDSTISICNTIENVECFLIFENKKGEFETVQSKGFQKYIFK